MAALGCSSPKTLDVSAIGPQTLDLCNFVDGVIGGSIDPSKLTVEQRDRWLRSSKSARGIVNEAMNPELETLPR